jgi:micrococcal nuclease
VSFRYRRRPRSAVWLIVVIVLLIAIRLQREPVHVPPVEQAGTVHVQRVVDGDTLLLVGGERVRLIGVDTPESVKPDTPEEPYGREASEFTKSIAEDRDVRLEFDRERVDQYGRTLAYVYVGDLLLNEELVRQGFSRAETRFPFRADMQRRLLAAEEEAREGRRGIWSLDE